MLNYFERLGATIAGRWSRANRDARAFTALALDSLESSPPGEHVDTVEILHAATALETLPPQAQIDVDFGQPALTVFAARGFHIDVLFWTTATTAIHQHAFSGAFAVLEGASLQTRYSFVCQERANEHMLFGKLLLEDARVLAKGSIEPIQAGGALIHAVFHLPAPTVTVVVRTTNDLEHLPQYRYVPPGLAVNGDYRDSTAVRKRQILALVARCYREEYAQFARGVLASADLLLSHAVLTDAANVLKERTSLVELTEVVRERHGGHAHMLAMAAAEEARRCLIVKARTLIVDPELRFFLALLLNVPERQWILSLLGARHPGCDVMDVAADYACRVATVLLGSPFDDTDVALVRALMSGLTEEHAVAFAEANCVTTAAKDSRQAQCAKLANSPLRPLFPRYGQECAA